MEKKAILTWKAFAIFGAQAREVFSNIVSMAVAALLVVVFDLELVFGAVPPLLSFLLIVLHVEYSATIPFTSWPAFLLCPKKAHTVRFLSTFPSLDIYVIFKIERKGFSSYSTTVQSIASSCQISSKRLWKTWKEVGTKYNMK